MGRCLGGRPLRSALLRLLLGKGPPDQAVPHQAENHRQPRLRQDRPAGHGPLPDGLLRRVGVIPDGQGLPKAVAQAHPVQLPGVNVAPGLVLVGDVVFFSVFGHVDHRRRGDRPVPLPHIDGDIADQAIDRDAEKDHRRRKQHGIKALEPLHSSSIR